MKKFALLSLLLALKAWGMGDGGVYFVVAGPTQLRTYTFPDANATIARTDAANTFTGVQTMTSPVLTTPVLGTPSSGTLTSCTGYTTANLSGTITNAQLAGAIDLATKVTGVLPVANGGSATAFFIPTGQTLARTYTYPDLNASVVTGPVAGVITFAGPTLARTITVPDASFTVARTDAANTFTGVQTMTSPALTTPVLGTPSSGTLTNCTGYTTANLSGTITNAQLAGSIDLTAKVTGQLPNANGGNAGTAATTATTGTMTVTMTSAVITITPTGACTFNGSGGLTGQTATFAITTSGTSSFILTFGTNFVTTGTLSTGTVSAKRFTVTFRCINGTAWWETSRTAAM